MEYGNGKTNHLVWRKVENRYHNDSEAVDVSNENVNTALLSREVRLGSKVLDVGCGEGKLGRILKKKNCVLYGIEIDQSAADYAKKSENYEDVFCLDIEKVGPSEVSDSLEKCGEFDYVALLDVLEHVINPTAVVMSVAKYLKSDGKILVSIPNVNNADIILNLLDGRFNYQDSGVLDNTHTKYFTKSSFIEWVQDMNENNPDFAFDCRHVGVIYGYTEYLEKLKKEMPLVYDFMQFNPQFNVIQNLFVLEKKEKNDSRENLELLLSEKKKSLVEILNQYLENGMNDAFMTDVAGVRMLRNERNILEAELISAEQGWVTCDKKLQEAVDGWKTCQKSLDEARFQMEEKEKELEQAVAGWKQCQEKLDEALEGWRQCNQRLEGL